MISRRKLAQRAQDKLEAQLFFANKTLQEYQLNLDGVIPTYIDPDKLVGMIEAQKREIMVLTYMFDLVESSY